MKKESTFNKNKYLILGTITLIMGLACLIGYFTSEDKFEKIEDLTFVEGQLDYSYSPWIYKYRYWSLKRRRRFRKHHFDLFLEDNHIRFTSGNHVLSNIYEEPFYNLMYDYPRPDVVIGYLDTDDPYVKNVYSISIDNLQLVDIEGVKDSIKKEKLVLLIAAAILTLLSLFFFFKHFRK